MTVLGQHSRAAKPSRRCGKCTACCSGALHLEVEGDSIYPGHPCRYRCNAGCGIYTSRPTICRSFVCGWLYEGSPLPPWLRPDRSGIILLPAHRLWRGVEIDVAVAARNNVRHSALCWLKEFSLMRQRPLLYQLDLDGVWYGWGPAEFRADLSDFVAQGGSLFAPRPDGNVSIEKIFNIPT